MPVSSNYAIMSKNQMTSPTTTLQSNQDDIDSNSGTQLNYQNPVTCEISGNNINLPLTTIGNHINGNAGFIGRHQSNLTAQKTYEENANTDNVEIHKTDNGCSTGNNSKTILTPIQQMQSSRDDITSLGGVSSINSQLSSVNSQNNNNQIEYNYIGSDVVNKGSKENLLNAYYNGEANSGGGSESGTQDGIHSRNEYGEDPGDGLGPLPPKWETAYTERGELYFIDHNTGTSHWLDPRLSKFQKKSLEDCSEDELPYGWEKIEDSLYGTYYIDHVNRKTQYENPVLEAKRRAAEQKQKNLNEHSVARPTTPSNDSSIYTKAAGGTSSTASTIDIAHRSMHPPPPLHGSHKFLLPYKFTRNPSEMRGERLSTTLIKSSRGLGITIVGGESLDGVEEFLQIKSIVPNGPAWLDNKLQPGDILVYINDTCVLGFTHHEMVNIFQSILPGDSVTLEICRGYPLPFDPNDPNTEVVTTIAVDGISSAPSKSHHLIMELNKNNHFDMLYDKRENIGKYPGNIDSSGFILMKKPEVYTLSIMKGAMGFGFTIADSAEGQKVKKILDRNCCAQLQEGDILLQINDVNVRFKTHNEVVQTLKDCSKSEPTTVKIQRSINVNSAIVPTTPLHNEKNVGNVAKLRKNFASNAGLYRSKTPTADLYSTQQKEILPMRPKTPLVDTRRPRVNTPNNELNEDDEVAATIRNGSGMEHNLDKKKSQVDGKSNNSLHDIDVLNQDIPFMDPYPKLVSSLSERLANSKLQEHRETTSQTQFQHDFLNDSNYSAIYGVSPFSSAMNTINPINQKLPPINTTNYMSRHPSFNSMNQSANNFPYQQLHHESCFCYSCQDLQASKNYATPVPHKMPQQAFYGQNEFSCPSYTSTITSVQAAHLQNERMQKRVNELLLDRRRVGFSSIENQHQLYDRNAVYSPNGLQQIPHQQHSPAISSVSQQPLINWSNTPFNNGDFHNQNSGLLDVADSADQYELNEVTLERQAVGFGFRIVGGTEEGSQVAIGHIVPGGAADNDHRINTGDEILSIDGVNVVNSSHHKVVSLMGDAALRGKVTMIVRRRIQLPNLTKTIPSATTMIHYPYDVVVSRHENEGFGFVIISSSNQFYGSTIGKLIAGSPADRCGNLKVGDRIVAVNRIEIAGMSHGDVVNLIKESGLHVRLTIGYPIKDFACGTVSHDGTITPTILSTSDVDVNSTTSHHSTDQQKPTASPNTIQNRSQIDTPIERSNNNIAAATSALINPRQQPQQL